MTANMNECSSVKGGALVRIFEEESPIFAKSQYQHHDRQGMTGREGTKTHLPGIINFWLEWEL